MLHIQAIPKSMANCVKSRFSLNLQLFSVVLKSAPAKHIASYCPWDSHQIHSSSCRLCSKWCQTFGGRCTLLRLLIYCADLNKIIHGLKDSSPGWDGICTKVVKPTSQQILPILTHLFNLSITRGVFPKELKTGKVVLIYSQTLQLMWLLSHAGIEVKPC